MTMRHRGEGTALWFRVFRYRWLERQLASRPDTRRILDLGCGGGENMWRFVEWGRAPLGLDTSQRRLTQARVYGPVVQSDAAALPFASDTLDLVYTAHLLHHVADYRTLLREVLRCLRPGGTLFLVETVEDHPLVRLGRDLYPRWRGDAVETRLTYRQLVSAVQEAGFDVLESGQYSVLFWVWEVLPERLGVLDRFTPLFTALEVPLSRLARRWAAHCYCVAAAGQHAGQEAAPPVPSHPGTPAQAPRALPSTGWARESVWGPAHVIARCPAFGHRSNLPATVTPGDCEGGRGGLRRCAYDRSQKALVLAMTVGEARPQGQTHPSEGGDLTPRPDSHTMMAPTGTLLHSRDTMDERIQCSIGVMAYNEERNIGNLLRALCAQRLNTVSIGEIVVVASGCTDNTECVVEQEIACDSRIRLLVQERREGKMSAINLFLQNAQCGIVVIINADVLPEEDCIERLVAPFADPKVGITGGRPVAINSMDSLPGFAAHLLWDMHHEISLTEPKMGELIAYYKFPELEISPDTVDDEGIVEELVARKGMRKVYVPQAVLYLRGPTTVRDFVKRRRNIYAGHLQLRARTRYTPSTFNTFRLVRKLFGPLVRMIGANPLRLARAAGVVLMEICARFLGAYDFYVAKRDHRIWEPADSSKELILKA